MKRTIFIIAAVVSSAITLHSQPLEEGEQRDSIATLESDSVKLDILERLATPTRNEGKVVVTPMYEAYTILEGVRSEPKNNYIRGYRVGLFFDNGQDARMKANQMGEQFSELFPDIRVHISYENPYFKVAAGDCLTQEEAVILLERVRREFPKAFIQRDRIAIEE